MKRVCPGDVLLTNGKHTSANGCHMIGLADGGFAQDVRVQKITPAERRGSTSTSNETAEDTSWMDAN
eukprot:8965290-Pyramimonas_sp.AAC.1